MKTKFIIIIFTLLLVMGINSCSKNEYDPEDYITSLLSGEYKKYGIWKLYVTINGSAIEDYGYVRFDSKYLKEADFKFVDIIPNEHVKEYKNIPLLGTEEGCAFTIEDTINEKVIVITGVVSLGEMKINLNI